MVKDRWTLERFPVIHPEAATSPFQWHATTITRRSGSEKEHRAPTLLFREMEIDKPLATRVGADSRSR